MQQAESPPAEADGQVSRRINRRAAAVFGLLFAAMAVLLGRVFFLQKDTHAEMLRLESLQSVMRVPLPAQRGCIVGAEGLLLAGNGELPSVYADPQFISEVADLQSVSQKLARVLGLDETELYQELLRRREGRFAWVARRIDPQLAGRVERAELPGVVVFMEPIRQYPQGRLAAHVVGFKGRDIGGLTGLEFQYDRELAGVDGEKRMIATAGRRPVWLADNQMVPARHGHTLVLTLYATIQQYVEETLDKIVVEQAPQWASCIVMNPDTGAIIAMANRPTYSPQHFADAPEDNRANRAISYPFEPGSVFKPFIAIRALEENEVRLGEQIFCHNGLFLYRGRRLRDHHPYGNLTFEEIVYRSSNIGMALVGLRLGKQRVYDSEVRFGFGDRTGIDLPCEDAGMVTRLAPSPDHPNATIWNDIYTITSVPMGHEVAVTPLQLLTAWAALANGGRYMRPYVVARMVDPVTKEDSFVAAPHVVRRVCPEPIVTLFRKKVLYEVVANDRGTGKQARSDRYRLFGKTGTAQLAATGGGRGYVPNKYIGSFLCGGPLDEPRLVCVVTVFVPSRGQYYGGSVAAPYAGEIMRRALAYLRVPPDKPAAGDAV